MVMDVEEYAEVEAREITWRSRRILTPTIRIYNLSSIAAHIIVGLHLETSSHFSSQKEQLPEESTIG